MIHSGMKQHEVIDAFRSFSNNEFKFLFISPERIHSKLFKEWFEDMQVDLIVVDEAHCISQWGYDFRPAYLNIVELRTLLPGVPMLALTASATPAVQNDIIEKLKLTGHQTFFSTFFRPNLSFSVRVSENKILQTTDILNKVNGSAIVYCRSRKRTRDLAEALIAAGVSADYYHAGLTQIQRNKKQEAWIKNENKVIVCTNAFGMGIDKPDVRCVIHYDVPDTPEGYYQEAGRAGRDSHKSYAVTLLQPKDLTDLKEGISLRFPDEKKVRDIYESICYYLQVPLGNGYQTVYDFDLLHFCNQFKYNSIEVISCIKLLEQNQHWRLNDFLFVPSRVNITTEKSVLEDLEQNHPDLDEVMKLLLRMYGGIWNHYVAISEFNMAQNAGVSADYIVHILNHLHAHHLIDYQKPPEQPQLYFLHDRYTKQDLRIDRALFETLKIRYSERINFMIQYYQNTKHCRFRSLVAYFGETINTDCGCCDICLKQKRSKNTTDDYAEVKSLITLELSHTPELNIRKFCKTYTQHDKEKILKTIRILLDEKQLLLNASGDLILPR